MFELGYIVRWNSSSTKMTVTAKIEREDGHYVECTWIDGEKHTAEFPIRSLILVKDKK